MYFTSFNFFYYYFVVFVFCLQFFVLGLSIQARVSQSPILALSLGPHPYAKICSSLTCKECHAPPFWLFTPTSCNFISFFIEPMHARHAHLLANQCTDSKRPAPWSTSPILSPRRAIHCRNHLLHYPMATIPIITMLLRCISNLHTSQLTLVMPSQGCS